MLFLLISFFVFRQSKTLALVGLIHSRYGTHAFGEFHSVPSHEVDSPRPITPGRSPHCVEKSDVRSSHPREMIHFTLGAGIVEALMVLQHSSILRRASSLCASMGGARMTERCRIPILGTEEGVQALCTSKAEITVASKTTEAPPACR